MSQAVFNSRPRMICITTSINPTNSHMDINGFVFYRTQARSSNNDLGVRCAKAIAEDDESILARSNLVEFIVSILIRRSRGDQLALSFSVYAQTGLRDGSAFLIGYLTFQITNG